MKRTHCYKPEKSKSQPTPQQTSSDQAPSATPVPPAIQAKSNEEGLSEWKAQQEKWERFGTPWMDKVPNPSGELAQPWIQRKLTLGQPGDKYEQEADRVASQVVQQINAPSLSQFNQEQSVQQENELEGEMQAKSLRAAIQRRQAMTDEEASADLESSINSARGGGQPLDAVLQQSMGQAMGADFSGVRVHTDTQSNHLNQSIQARAFTTGQDVFFRSGAYQPADRGGQELIAHELTHVVQQCPMKIQRAGEMDTKSTQELSKLLSGKSLEEAEKQLIEWQKEGKLTVEVGLIYDDKGSLKLAKAGKARSIDLDQTEYQSSGTSPSKRKVTHNHPSGSALTVTDISHVWKWAATEIRAVGKYGVSLAKLDHNTLGNYTVTKNFDTIMPHTIKGAEQWKKACPKPNATKKKDAVYVAGKFGQDGFMAKYYTIENIGKKVAGITIENKMDWKQLYKDRYSLYHNAPPQEEDIPSKP